MNLEEQITVTIHCTQIIILKIKKWFSFKLDHIFTSTFVLHFDFYQVITCILINRTTIISNVSDSINNEL